MNAFTVMSVSSCSRMIRPGLLGAERRTFNFPFRISYEMIDGHTG